MLHVLGKELDGSFNIIIHVQLVGQAPSIIDQIEAKHCCTKEGVLSCHRAEKNHMFLLRLGRRLLFRSCNFFVYVCCDWLESCQISAINILNIGDWCEHYI